MTETILHSFFWDTVYITLYILYSMYTVACSASSCTLRHCQLLWSGAPLSSSGLRRRYRNIPDWMNEWISFSPFSVVDVIMGDLFLCMNSCMYAWMNVYLCIRMLVCMMYVCTSSEWTLSMSKLKQNSWFVVRKYLLFTGKLYFSQTTNFTEVVASFASYVATALPVNSVGVTTPAKKIM